MLHVEACTLHGGPSLFHEYVSIQPSSSIRSIAGEPKATKRFSQGCLGGTKGTTVSPIRL
jgi:hypothetical protein